MKAAIFLGPSEIVVKDVPEPKPDDRNLILKIHRASICNGSDSAVLKGERDIIKAHPELKFPMIGGHECSGEIVHAGKHAEGGFNIGDRIAFWCKAEGAFTEYNDIYPQYYAIARLSSNISYDEGSIMEMLGSTMCRGTLVELGADAVVDAGKENVAKVINEKFGRVDDVIHATGKNLFNLPLEIIKDRGKLIMYGCVDEGITFDSNYCLYHGIDIIGFKMPYLDRIRELMAFGEKLVSLGRLKIKPLITHHIKLEGIAEGIKMCAYKPGECIKVVVDIM